MTAVEIPVDTGTSEGDDNMPEEATIGPDNIGQTGMSRILLPATCTGLRWYGMSEWRVL